jgi:hypothetical protein
LISLIVFDWLVIDFRQAFDQASELLGGDASVALLGICGFKGLCCIVSQAGSISESFFSCVLTRLVGGFLSLQT